jgi:hypothetical protein
MFGKVRASALLCAGELIGETTAPVHLSQPDLGLVSTSSSIHLAACHVCADTSRATRRTPARIPRRARGRVGGNAPTKIARLEAIALRSPMAACRRSWGNEACGVRGVARGHWRRKANPRVRPGQATPFNRRFHVAISIHDGRRLNSICFSATSLVLFARPSHPQALASYRSEDSVTQGNAGEHRSFLTNRDLLSGRSK